MRPLLRHAGLGDGGQQTFIEVGQALLEIRDRRLYRETYGTFEEYCQERWGMTRRHANRQIGAAHVVEVLGPIGPIPRTERQAREAMKVHYSSESPEWYSPTEVIERAEALLTDVLAN